MSNYRRIIGIVLSGIALMVGGCSSGNKDQEVNSPNDSQAITEEQWIDGSETEEDFDFVLDEDWLTLNDM